MSYHAEEQQQQQRQEQQDLVSWHGTSSTAEPSRAAPRRFCCSLPPTRRQAGRQAGRQTRGELENRLPMLWLRGDWILWQWYANGMEEELVPF